MRRKKATTNLGDGSRKVREDKLGCQPLLMGRQTPKVIMVVAVVE